jgi:nitrite reductase (NO-forming)
MTPQRISIATIAVIGINLVMTDVQPAQADEVRYVARDAADIPAPITRTEPATVSITSTIEEVTAELADGTTFPFWTFDGTVPGPLMRVMQGDTVELTLVNPASSHMHHNIDLHAVNGPHGGGMETMVAPGESKTFTFEATHAGSFVYHCAVSPAWRHVAQGMYGAILVEPPGGLPPVDREFFVMQGEWYTTGAFGVKGLQGFSTTKAFSEQPEYFTLNGHVDALTELNPLHAEVGETIRIFFGVGGPNIGSNFHVIGEIFDKVYTGSPETYVVNEETWYVPPGSIATFELTLDKPGDYLLVDHALTRTARGAAGVLHVTLPVTAPEPSTVAMAILAIAGFAVAQFRTRPT